ncbi:8-oxoguanine DNA glycosylase OGG fold protein [Brevibacterium yomogidense]|uniref:8-oxoguanine DNA glycosylase OGG fold protein n=1 Tax=Brevibacterium yomogidense TaxID=946573 RepID=UPI0018DF3DF9|nr:hypothetical protein [Brevibacterium yomogidense]
MTTRAASPSPAAESGPARSPADFPDPPAALVDLLSAPFTPQKRFRVPRAAWLRRFDSVPHAAEAISALPSWINRDDAVAAFRSHWPDNVTGAFATTMVWAYGEKAGYAPYRVLRVLTASPEPDGMPENPRVRDVLRRAIELTCTEGAAEGFSYLNDCTHKVRSHQRDDADLLVGVDCGRIYGLGPSFFTKWLHIGALALGDGAAPTPMLDNQALTWLDEHARTVDRACLTQDHRRKVELLHRKWHAESVFSSCDDDCPFTTGDASKSCTGLLPGGSDETGWSPTTPEGDLLRLRSGRTDHYARYIELLTAWGAPFRLDASQVGDRIYRLIRDDGEQRTIAA